MIDLHLNVTEFSFSLSELFALIGLVQAVAVIVYVVFRAGHIRHVVVPVLCFIVLAAGFLLDFGQSRLSKDLPLYPFIQNGFWMALPAFSILLILQVADFGRFPAMPYWVNLMVPVVSVCLGWGLGAYIHDSNCAMFSYCGLDARLQVSVILGILAGLLCFLMLWLARGSFEPLQDDKETKGERYWLILSFIIVNVLLLSVTLLYVSNLTTDQSFLLMRDILGVGIAYIASTSLFRIYPPSIKLEKQAGEDDLGDDDIKLIGQLSQLLDLDKVYQELGYSRSDLARELGTSDARVSKIVNIKFGKSVPQVINERRVQDSLLLLMQTDAQISVISEQVGFSSVPTFNRVFKDIMGMSPSEYRLQQQKNQDIS